MAKSSSAFKTISEVSTELDLPQHVLRFWESKFVAVKPMKRGGGRRYYRPEDIVVLRRIQGLLYDDGYTIKGVQKLFKDGGKDAIKGEAGPEKPQSPETEQQLGAAHRRELQSIMGELKEIRALARR